MPPFPPWRRPRSRRLARLGKLATACGPAGCVDAGDGLCRNPVLSCVTPREDHEIDKCAERAETRRPPNVPDEREAHHCGEERADDTGRAVSRNLNVLVDRCLAEPVLIPRTLLHAPVCFFAVHVR